jgi:hypothetical protein
MAEEQIRHYGKVPTRTTPGINQPTVNKTYKNTTNSSNYFGNVGKEAKQWFDAYRKTSEATGEVGPGTDARASRLSKKEDKAGGQLWGAVLQGRRYDDKTGKQIKPGPKNMQQRRGFKIP